MQAIILAAGKGSRLSPLTDKIPKCLVEVNGKPIIDYTIDILRELHIDDIIVVCGYKEDILRKHLNKINYTFVKPITFVHQEKLTGTADAIYLCKDYIKDNFLVLSGDIIYDKGSLYKLRGIINSLLYTKQDERLYEYGTIEIYGDIVYHINEKSTKPTSNMVNCGAYHFSKDVFKYIPMTEVDSRFDERIITNTINYMIDYMYEFTSIEIPNLNEITRVEDIKKVERRLK